MIQGQSSWLEVGEAENLAACRCQTEAVNSPHSPFFCKLANQSPNVTDPLPPPGKLIGFGSISGTTSGKNGVDPMLTPVNLVATPLLMAAASCDFCFNHHKVAQNQIMK